MEMWMIWVIAAIIFAIIEIYTPSFFIIWFSAGSIAAAISSVFTDNEIIQLVIFAVVSLIFILSTKRISDKFITKKNSYKTNTDKMIGTIGLVIDSIDPLKSVGRVKVAGEVWKATTADNSKIEKGQTIKVDQINGVTLTVSVINQNN